MIGQLQFLDKVIDVSVLLVVRVPQVPSWTFLRMDKVVDATCLQVLQISCRGTEADSHGLDCSADHKKNPQLLLRTSLS